MPKAMPPIFSVVPAMLRICLSLRNLLRLTLYRGQTRFNKPMVYSSLDFQSGFSLCAENIFETQHF